tara:strand:+ start:121 stop:528 length:408 start_codon:yes stop_codon:yes gene_type:complete
MSQKSTRSIGIYIRRFIAGFLLLSIVMGLIEDITSGNFSGASMDGFAFGLIIVFFLAFYSRKSKETKEVEFDEEIDTVQDEKLQSNVEDFDFEYIEIENDKQDNPSKKPSPGYNPVNDSEGMFSRLFKGKNHRYG